jgi:hypothetical protein
MAPVGQYDGGRGWAAQAGPTVLTFLILFAFYAAVGRAVPGTGDDLVQDYVSARAWMDGADPTRPLDELRARVGLPPAGDAMKVAYTPHPPGAILATVPFAALGDFSQALLAYQLAQLASIAIAWNWARGLVGSPPGAVAWAVCGGVFGLWSPVWQGVSWGQPDGFLALAAVGVWAAARSHRPVAFGVALGVACSLRPFFALLAVLAGGWPGRRAGAAALATAVTAALPFAVYRVWPWDWLRLASAAEVYVRDCGSVPGVLGLGAAGGMAVYAAAAAGLLVARLRGLPADATVAVGLVLAMLTYPLAWFHYDVILLPVVAWVFGRAEAAGDRWAVRGVAAYVLLRAIPTLDPALARDGGVGAVVQHQGVIQVAARVLLLAAAVRVSGRASAAA